MKRNIIRWLVVSLTCVPAWTQNNPPPPSQTNPPPPIVTVAATLTNASEIGPVVGTFTLTRTGSTNDSLFVQYELGGTARDGIDFLELPDHIRIPAGSATATVTVTPRLDLDIHSETNETVVLQLQPPDDPRPDGAGLYVVGWPSNAVVNITESGTLPPRPPLAVRLVNPEGGTEFVAGANIKLVAEAHEPDGRIASVAFLAGTNTLGVVTNDSTHGDFDERFALVWSNVTAGAYSLTAQATDDQGTVATSEPVSITVVGTNGLPVVTVVAATNSVPAGGHALFIITRSDGTNADLTVQYSLGGPAAQGEDDHEGMDPRASISAGSNSVTIDVGPLPDRDDKAGTNATLVLTLEPAGGVEGTNAQLYVVGSPGAASVVVLEEVEPPPASSTPRVSIVARDPIAFDPGTNAPATNAPAHPATFVVRRRDGTNADLTISYSIGGTASNGVDYVLLPGTLTIPAGQHTALIPLTALSDPETAPEKPETVVLTLEPPVTASNATPAYVVGRPAKASALIVDQTPEAMSSHKIRGGPFRLITPGDAGMLWFRLDVSSNLVDWDTVVTNVVTGGQVQFVDPDANDEGWKFYRVVPLPGTPPGDD